MAITDLTGTKWLFDDALSGGITAQSFNINFTSNSNSYQCISLDDDYQDHMVTMMYYTQPNDSGQFVYAYFDGGSGGEWYNNAYKIIEITDGTDVTNASLISWIDANAEQVLPPLSIDLSTLSGWADVTTGSHTLQIRAKAVGYRTSELSTAVSFTKAPSGYSVTVQGDLNYGGEIVFYDGQNDEGALLYDTTAYVPTFDQELTITSGYLYVRYMGNMTTVHGTPSSGITLVNSSDDHALYSVTANGTITDFYNENCIVEGTPITLVDGSTKNIEDITYDDDLLVWNFYEAKFDSAKPMWIMTPKVADRYNEITFEDSRVLKLVGSNGYHRIYNDEVQAFTHTGTNDTPDGTTTFTDRNSYLKVASQKVIKEQVNYYNIITDKHYNLFANGILTSCRLSNRFGIENMKYTDEVKMTEEEVNEYIKCLPN